MYKFELNSVNVTDIRESRESEIECVSVNKKDDFSPQCGATLKTNKPRAKEKE
jgi:hypothetical protein